MRDVLEKIRQSRLSAPTWSSHTHNIFSIADGAQGGLGFFATEKLPALSTFISWIGPSGIAAIASLVKTGCSTPSARLPIPIKLGRLLRKILSHILRIFFKHHAQRW